jgi:hypothetical protein
VTGVFLEFVELIAAQTKIVSGYHGLKEMDNLVAVAEAFRSRLHPFEEACKGERGDVLDMNVLSLPLREDRTALVPLKCGSEKMKVTGQNLLRVTVDLLVGTELDGN